MIYRAAASTYSLLLVLITFLFVDLLLGGSVYASSFSSAKIVDEMTDTFGCGIDMPLIEIT